MTDILLTASIALVAGCVNSVTGFGFALLSVPILSLTLGPKVAVPLVVLLSTALDVLLFGHSYKDIDVGKVSYLLLGAIVGLPFGAYVLSALSADVLKKLIGAITIALASLLCLGVRRQFRRERLASIGAGIVSGALKGSTGMPGPPIILLGLNQDWDQTRFRGTLIGYFTFVGFLTIPVFLRLGLFTKLSVKLAIVALPLLVLGFIGGTKLRNRAPQAIFRGIALILIMLAGASGLLGGIF